MNSLVESVFDNDNISVKNCDSWCNATVFVVLIVSTNNNWPFGHIEFPFLCIPGNDLNVIEKYGE